MGKKVKITSIQLFLSDNWMLHDENKSNQLGHYLLGVMSNRETYQNSWTARWKRNWEKDPQES